MVSAREGREGVPGAGRTSPTRAITHRKRQLLPLRPLMRSATTLHFCGPCASTRLCSSVSSCRFCGFAFILGKGTMLRVEELSLFFRPFCLPRSKPPTHLRRPRALLQVVLALAGRAHRGAPGGWAGEGGDGVARQLSRRLKQNVGQ